MPSFKRCPVCYALENYAEIADPFIDLSLEMAHNNGEAKVIVTCPECGKQLWEASKFDGDNVSLLKSMSGKKDKGMN